MYKNKFPSHLNMFEGDSHSNRPAPKLPTTDGIEYPRAASWSSSTVAEIMRDPLGTNYFICLNLIINFRSPNVSLFFV